ncbi:hypothetical protein DS031_18660 [Bacillus taeanensis]|uniref:Uncharacterized protein n=1 Tax=Bacillus taeanensis TaxID=273032 RepID=A0A366XRE0_9BACI|nr:hypothetical protein DS031_18660 [Bacillus taeanensis]
MGERSFFVVKIKNVAFAGVIVYVDNTQLGEGRAKLFFCIQKPILFLFLRIDWWITLIFNIDFQLKPSLLLKHFL